ncbi:MAG: hypothetical protein IGS39_21735 [Calothrix sp. C42_A2020_038]|nr:hypothetical protein [Calothrix sp. C42_A2020_038]
MPVSYSKDLRGRVIAVWEAKEGSQRQLAQRFTEVDSYLQLVSARLLGHSKLIMY